MDRPTARAKRSAKKRKRTLATLLEDEWEYDMGVASSTKSKNAIIRDGCQFGSGDDLPKVESIDTDADYGRKFGSRNSLHFRSSNISLVEVDVGLDDSKNEQGKKQKISHFPNKESNNNRQETSILTKAKAQSKRLDTPFVRNTRAPFESTIRRESIRSTGGVDILQIHEEKSPVKTFSHNARDNTEERALSRLANRSVKMDNSDIFQTGRNDIFNNTIKPFSTSRSHDLPHASQRKSGPTSILSHIGKQVLANAAMDRSIDDKHQCRMMASSQPEDMPYVPSMDTPKRLPRLAPIANAKHSQTGSRRNKPPWERDVLSDDRNFSCQSPFDLNPPLFNSSGKSWDDDVMPLEVRLGTGGRLKVKMMDDTDD